MESRAPAQWLKERLKVQLLIWVLVPVPLFFAWLTMRLPLWPFPLLVLATFLVAEKNTRRLFRDRLVGARGELRVANALLALESKGYIVLHDIETGHGNIDHVVVGATGLFALETKAWRGRVYLGKGSTLIRNGFDESRTVRQAVQAALEIRRRVERLGVRGWVQGYIVLTRTKLPLGPIRLRRVTVLEFGDLVRELEGRPVSLSPQEVARAASAILGANDPRAKQHHKEG